MSVNITAYVSQYNSSACGWALNAKEEVMENFKKNVELVVVVSGQAYEKLTDGKATLIAGIVLIGVIDFLLPDVMFIIREPVYRQIDPRYRIQCRHGSPGAAASGFIIDVICISAPFLI